MVSGVEVQFRNAATADAPAILAWFSSHAQAMSWGGTEVPENLDPSWFAREIETSTDVYRVAYTAHEPIIGVYGFRRFADEKRIHIIRVAVAPSHRGRGIARRLIDDAVSAANVEKGFVLSLNVYGSNVQAIAVYEHLGFQRVKTRDAPEDASGVAIYMERPAL